MNKYLFEDAISCLDSKYIEEYITIRRKLRLKKKYIVFMKALIASCFALFIISSILLLYLFSLKNPKVIVSTIATSYLVISLLICMACTVGIGFVAWAIGKRIIRKNCERKSVI